MSDLYTSLQVSPKKKRCPPVDDDEVVTTPKKMRRQIAPPSPVSFSRRKGAAVVESPVLPDHLQRLISIQRSLHRALSHALATSAVSPSSDTGTVPNVLNNFTLTSAAGLSRTCTLDDIKRLCWLWEWGGNDLPQSSSFSDTDNPFLDNPATEKARQWKRGGMGMVITPTSHLSRTTNKRVPAYGIGIEVEMDIDKEMLGGMAAVARWTLKGESRLKELSAKLHRWVESNKKSHPTPLPPLADLPALVVQVPKHSALTERLVSLSPKSPKTLATPSSRIFETPSSPSRLSSPTKPRATPNKRNMKDFAIPFPITPSSIPRKVPFNTNNSTTPQTPARTKPLLPFTPSSSAVSEDPDSSPERPATPVHQIGSDAESAPATPSSSRRAALYERIRRRSESQTPSTPSKARITTGNRLSKDQLMKLSQEETRRRCLLGRLGGVAESVWMLFNSQVNGTSSSPSARKKRSLPTSEVVPAIIKSSPVPISSAEAQESIKLITSLCPFFLKSADIGGEDWLEMPASAVMASKAAQNGSPRKGDPDEELKTLSPRRVKKEMGGLREVRERIRRELEDDN